MANSSDTPEPAKGRFIGRFLLSVVLVGVAALAVVCVMGWNERQAESNWRSRVESHGARVVTAGYGGRNVLFHVPILGELFATTQVEVFLPNTTVAQDVLPLLHEFPPLGRLWVHKVNVDDATVKLLEAERPDVQIIRYTAAGE